MRRESALTHRGKIGGVRLRSFRIQIRKQQTLESRIGDLEREGEEGFRSVRVQGFNVGFQGRVAPIISRAFRPICKRTGLIRPWS